MNQLLARVRRPWLAQEHRHTPVEICTSECPAGCKVIGCVTCDIHTVVAHVADCPAGAR
jgi:hypothetical protein